MFLAAPPPPPGVSMVYMIFRAQVEQCRFERYQRINAKPAASSQPTGGRSAAAPPESGGGGGEASSPAPPSGGGDGAGEGGGGPPAEPSAVAPPPLPPPSYTRLFSRNEDVDRLNVEELQKLEGIEDTVHAIAGSTAGIVVRTG